MFTTCPDPGYVFTTLLTPLLVTKPPVYNADGDKASVGCLETRHRCQLFFQRPTSSGGRMTEMRGGGGWVGKAGGGVASLGQHYKYTGHIRSKTIKPGEVETDQK